jgi:hypothetical protein
LISPSYQPYSFVCILWSNEIFNNIKINDAERTYYWVITYLYPSYASHPPPYYNYSPHSPDSTLYSHSTAPTAASSDHTYHYQIE